jgi:hypothetical protein
VNTVVPPVVIVNVAPAAFVDDIRYARFAAVVG